jgi:hypothetical protein
LKEQFYHLIGEIKAVWLVMRVTSQQTQTSHSPHRQTPTPSQKRGEEEEEKTTKKKNKEKKKEGRK